MPILAHAFTAQGLPTLAAVANGARASGWTIADGLFDRERFPVAFAAHQRVAYLRSDDGVLSVEITALGRRAGRLDSLGVKILLNAHPVGTKIDADLARLTALLKQIGLSATACEGAAAVIARLDSLPDPVEMPFTKPQSVERRVAGALVVNSRGRFVTGLNGRYGQVLLQFTPSDSPELNWPTVQEVEALVPNSRRTILSGNSDVPAILDPAITAMACHPVAAGYRCRYQTTVADWVGKDAPRSRFEDVYHRRPDGRWFLVES